MPGAIATLPAFRTKTDLVYEALRQSILAGQYPPGTRLVVDQLALQLGTSKVPVREAVVRLAGEGWLQMKPHVGAIVPELSPDEILETSIIRAAIEGVAVRHSAEHLSREDLARLRALLRRLDDAAAKHSASYPDLNIEFHAAAFHACPFSALRSLATSLLEKSARLRTVRFLPEYMAESQGQHRALLEALERRDAEAAERITRQHIEHAGHLLWQYALRLAGQPEAKRRPGRRP